MNEQSVSAQFLQFTSLVIPNLPRNFRPERLAHYVGPGKNELKDKLTAAFADDLISDSSPLVVTAAEISKPAEPLLHTVDQSKTLFSWLDAWKKFCKEFKIKPELDFETAKERGLTRPSGFDWIIYTPSGFTAREAIDKLCKPQFTVYESIPVEKYSLERQPNKARFILARPTIEPDREWLNTTADEMQAAPVPFLDCRERYILEAFHYWLTKNHLDINGWTRCPRSRTPRGEVANARWFEADEEFYAGWDDGDDRDPSAGGREAVILET